MRRNEGKLGLHSGEEKASGRWELIVTTGTCGQGTGSTELGSSQQCAEGMQETAGLS